MQLSQLLFIWNKPSLRFRIASDVSYGPEHLQTLDVYRRRKAKKPKPVVIFWHGGSWTSGRKNRYPFIGASLTAMKTIAVIPDYRKYPQVHFPAFAEDAALVVKWVHEHIADYGGDPNNIIVMGHSAGAHTAAILAYQSTFLTNARVPLNVLTGFIGVAGPYDFYPRSDLQMIFPVDDPKQPWRATKNVDRGDIKGLIMHGRLDWIVSSNNVSKLATVLRAAGNTVSTRLFLSHEHFTILVAYALPFRRWPGGIWHTTRLFIRSVGK